MRKIWEVDSLPRSGGSELNPDERRAVASIQQSCTNEAGRYVVGIPWRNGTPTANHSYETALKRLIHTEQRLRREESVGLAYSNVISQYIDKGYVRRVIGDSDSGSCWYLPHFPMLRPDKSTTKVRIVFDAAAKSSGQSLNDFILPGPKLQQDFVKVLVRFRREQIAIVCDISQMYLRVGLAPEDRRYHRFLWRDLDTGTSKPPDIYEFCNVVFGVNASPFLAQYVVQQHARQHEAEYPLAAEVVLQSTYMDDSMTSAENVEQSAVVRIRWIYLEVQ